jgi:hypothetical protein
MLGLIEEDIARCILDRETRGSIVFVQHTLAA